MAALALLFIGALPFVGFESISARISAAGLLTTLALLLLFPGDDSVASTASNTALLCPAARDDSPRCGYRTRVSGSGGWALWLRISQYGWSPERLYGVLITIVALVWAIGFAPAL